MISLEEREEEKNGAKHFFYNLYTTNTSRVPFLGYWHSKKWKPQSSTVGKSENPGGRIIM